MSSSRSNADIGNRKSNSFSSDGVSSNRSKDDIGSRGRSSINGSKCNRWCRMSSSISNSTV